MLDLYNNKYNKTTLKANIYSLKLIDILKTQTLDITFIVRYILSDLYQLTEEEKNIDVDLVLKYQPHIHREELIASLEDYNSDDDSIHDFETYSESQTK
jgi:hypothetical protein